MEIFFCFILMCLLTKLTNSFDYDFEYVKDEVFGSGNLIADRLSRYGYPKYQTSSIEDLILLFNSEKLIFQLFYDNSTFRDDSSFSKLMLQFEQQIDYNINEESDTYVYHPINSFHLLKRSSSWIPRLKKWLPKKILKKYDLTLLSSEYVRACCSLANIQEYHDIDVNEMAEGMIINMQNGRKFWSKSELTSSDLYNIGKEARKLGYFSGAVKWLKVALQKAKIENQPKNYQNRIRNQMSTIKKEHDEIYWSMNFDEIKVPVVRINHLPYFYNSKHNLQKKIMSNHTFYYESRYDNLAENFTHSAPLGNPNITKAYYFLHKRTQKLCQGTFERPAILDKNLSCLRLHHNNAYLKLGPFKCEIIQKSPEIMIVHEFGFSNEMSKIVSLAKGKLVATPSYTNNKQEVTNARTSKMTYLNDEKYGQLRKLSERIQLITRFSLFKEKFASEHYKVMNYGIGGKVQGHWDSTGNITGNVFELPENGAERVLTFMLYLTTVEAGGSTVFPQPGLSVSPEEGKALFWFNVGPQHHFDSRTFHLGCPVLFGNKWIVTKWHRWISSYKSYPCFVKSKYFSIMNT